MKKIFLLSFASLTLCIAISSCDNGAYTATPGQTSNTTNPIATNSNSGGSGNNGGSNVAAGTFTADINGTHFIATTASWGISSGVLEILGGKNMSDPSNVEYLTIFISNYNGAGTYQSGTFTYTKGPSGQGGFIQSSTGYLNISSVQGNNMKGTFHFSSGNDNVTNGVFNINQ